MTWIYAIPGWLFALLVIGLMCATSAAGLVLVHRGKRDGQLSHNDVAGPVITTVGTVLAVMLSFMVVVVWQEFDASAANVQHEASAVSDLYHLAPALPAPVRTKLQAAIRSYVQIVIDREWELMRSGQRSMQARNVSLSILGIVAGYEPKTASQVALQQEAFELIKTFSDYRRSRIFDNQESIPAALWVTMIFIGAVTIGSSYFFEVRNFRAHLLMTLALAAVIGSIFVLIVEFDLPFRGDVSVPPTAFVHALGDMTQPGTTK